MGVSCMVSYYCKTLWTGLSSREKKRIRFFRKGREGSTGMGGAEGIDASRDEGGKDFTRRRGGAEREIQRVVLWDQKKRTILT